MSALAPILQGFFTDKLIRQRRAGPNTIAAYRDTWRLLLQFASRATVTAPSGLDLTQLDAALVTAFWTTWKPNEPIAPPPAMLAWPRSGRYSTTRHYMPPSTPRTSAGCWQSHPSDVTGQ